MRGTKRLRDPAARGLANVVVWSKNRRRRFSPAVLKFRLYSYGGVLQLPDQGCLRFHLVYFWRVFL